MFNHSAGAIFRTRVACRIAKSLSLPKVSRLLQPSVIFMDDAEKPFVKKIPKTDRTDPKRLKKDLPKLVKGITGEDRVLLIGTSSKPWDGDQKLLYQTYDKVVYIPRPDYGTVSLVWKDLLYKVSKKATMRRKRSESNDMFGAFCIHVFFLFSCLFRLLIVACDFVFQYSGIDRQFDTPAIAKACDGFTIGAILEAIDEVSCLRIARRRYRC